MFFLFSLKTIVFSVFYLCLLLLFLMLLYIHLFKSCSPHDHMLQTKRNSAAKHVHQMLQKK